MLRVERSSLKLARNRKFEASEGMSIRSKWTTPYSCTFSGEIAMGRKDVSGRMPVEQYRRAVGARCALHVAEETVYEA